MNPSQITDLVTELCMLPRETEWLEFKLNDCQPEDIGEYISALSNSAALEGHAWGYLIWGISDETHEIIGTTFDPTSAKKGNEELEGWLLRLLEPRIDFKFFKVEIKGKSVVLLAIGKAFRHPVRFQGVEYIRIGSYKKKLKDHQEKERELWKVFDQSPFEDAPAATDWNASQILETLDYPAYFRLLGLPVPTDLLATLKALEGDELVRPQDNGYWTVTNLGALLLAHDVTAFRSIRRKAARIIVYKGNDKINGIREVEVKSGYASGFEQLLSTIDNLLPRSESHRTSFTCLGSHLS